MRLIKAPLTLVALFAASTAQADDVNITLSPAGTYASGVYAEGAAEIVAYDAASQQVFVVNADAASLDVLDISDPDNPTLANTIDLSSYGGGVNSVAVHGGVVAAAVQANVKQDDGSVVFFDTAGNFLSQVTAGALPDMVTFTPNGEWVLVANEGEPSDDYSNDPEGSVTIIDVSGGAASLTDSDACHATFDGFDAADLDDSVRVFSPGATVAEDLEPEYIAVKNNSKKAWVTLQENNAIAEIKIEKCEIKAIHGLGFKDHSDPANMLDASNKDGAINITSWPTLGMYQPDSIAVYQTDGGTYLITANEGDARDYDGFSEETRIGDLTLDPTAFPDAATLQDDANLGRLKTTTTLGDTDGDGDHDVLYSYGARSFSIWDTDGNQVYDSGDDFGQITSAAYPDDFNSDDEENDSFDDRSDDKGAEPEGVAVGKIDGHWFAFIGLERVGGIMVYDVTDPGDVQFIQYINTRDFSGDPEAGTAGDMSPEGIAFISGDDSPTGEPLLVVGYEISGTTTVFEIEVD